MTIESHAEALRAWAARLTQDRAMAEDVVQGTFVVALERRGAVEVTPGRERAWLFGIARRLALRALRDARRKPPPGWGAAEQPDDAAERAIEAERRALVGRAVAERPARQREVIQRVFHDGLTLDEAARSMGVSPGSARRHYHRAKVALRLALAAATSLVMLVGSSVAMQAPPASAPVEESWALPGSDAPVLEFTNLNRLGGSSW